MFIDKLEEPLKFNVEYYLENPTTMIDEQVDFWVRQSKTSKSFTNEEINEIIELSTKLKLRYQNYLEKNNYSDLYQEIKLVTEFFSEKIVLYAKLDDKVHVRNAYANLDTIFSKSYEIQYILNKLASSFESERYFLFFKFGKLTSELDFITGQTINAKEKARLAAEARKRKAQEFNKYMQEFLLVSKKTFLTNEALFDYLVSTISELNAYLKRINLNYSATCDDKGTSLTLKNGNSQIIIDHPSSDSNSHGQLKRIFNLF